MTENKTIELRRNFRDRQILAKAELTENGISVLITGGDLPHIGAVSVIGFDTPLQTTVFPGHKEAVITEEWAQCLCEEFKVPVVVSAGIHYDNILKEEIYSVMDLSGQMLEELVAALRD